MQNNDGFEKIRELTVKEHRRQEILRMFESMPQYNLFVDRMEGRRVRLTSGHWLIDFASCNYLGLDLETKLMDSIRPAVETYGVHPSWCRLVASPQIYDDLENTLAKLIGTEASIIFPTVTLVSLGVIPALVGKTGLLIIDKTAHETMYEAAKVARDSGAKLTSFKHRDFDHLEGILKENRDNPRKVILVDGVYSMSGDYAEIPVFQQLAKKYDAVVYIDDAHGFGVVGENPSPTKPFGARGNGIVKFHGCNYDRLLYVGGCSKAYSSLAAFVGCSLKMRDFLRAFATPYDLSGPCPTASLATLEAGLQVNEEKGEELRDTLARLTQQTIAGLRDLGIEVMNSSGFPIITAIIGDGAKLDVAAKMLFDEGILVTVAPYPMVPHGSEGLRISVTAANTEKEVAHLIAVFKKIRDSVGCAGN